MCTWGGGGEGMRWMRIHMWYELLFTVYNYSIKGSKHSNMSFISLQTDLDAGCQCLLGSISEGDDKWWWISVEERSALFVPSKTRAREDSHVHLRNAQVQFRLGTCCVLQFTSKYMMYRWQHRMHCFLHPDMSEIQCSEN